MLQNVKVLHDDGDNDDDNTKAIAIPRVFSENSRAKKFNTVILLFDFLLSTCILILNLISRIRIEEKLQNLSHIKWCNFYLIR